MCINVELKENETLSLIESQNGDVDVRGKIRSQSIDEDDVIFTIPASRRKSIAAFLNHEHPNT